MENVNIQRHYGSYPPPAPSEGGYGASASKCPPLEGDKGGGKEKTLILQHNLKK